MIAMKKILIAFSISFLLVSCKKEITELPPATQTGANTFGAKVDGSFFTPQGFGPFPANDILEARFLPNRDLYINARNFASSPNEKEFELFIKGATTIGTYQLNTTTNYPTTAVSYGYYVKRNITPQNEWITSAAYSGSVTITKIDSVNHFVSGTFQFNAINLYNAPQPMSVTEGRFDVKTQ
jgi:hypothetical protein